MRAVTYARVSGNDFAKTGGENLRAQTELCRDYCNQHGYTLVAELAEDDRGASGATFDLPELSQALELAHAGGFEVLVVRELDRLSRDLAKQLIVEQELKRAGVSIEYVLYDFPDTPEGRLNKNLRAMLAEYEREKIKQRTLRGKRQKAAQGLFVGNGKQPYGYKPIKNAHGHAVGLEINPVEAQVVRQVFAWYVQEGVSMLQIAERLTLAGIPRPRGSAGAWGKPSIARMLKNSIYIGQYRYHSHGTGEVFEIHVPEVVDLSTWQAAQTQIDRNKAKAARNSKGRYLLTGIVRCKCGYSSIGFTSRPNHISYYICNNQQHERCPGTLRADALEAATWREILELIQNPATFEAKLRQAQAAEFGNQEPQRAELEAVKALLAQAKTEARTLAEALAKAKGVVGEMLEQQMSEVNDRHEKLKARHDALTHALATRRFSDEAIAATLTFTEDVRVGLLYNPDNAFMRRVIDLFDARVICDFEGKKATLEYSLPVPTSFELQICGNWADG